MILGDNFFYGQNLTSKLIKSTKLKKGARVVLHKVTKPDLFGVAKINKNKKIISIKEKPLGLLMATYLTIVFKSKIGNRIASTIVSTSPPIKTTIAGSNNPIIVPKVISSSRS